MRHAHALFIHYTHISIADVHAMSGSGSRIEQFTVVEELNGGSSVSALHTLSVLLFGLGNMNLHAKTVFLGIFCDKASHLLSIGIFGMKAHVYQQLAVTCTVKVLYELSRLKKSAIFFYVLSLAERDDRA